MKVSSHQPSFLPWAGYWHKLMSSDVHVVTQGVKFDKGGYQNRVMMGGHWTALNLDRKTIEGAGDDANRDGPGDAAAGGAAASVDQNPAEDDLRAGGNGDSPRQEDRGDQPASDTGPRHDLRLSRCRPDADRGEQCPPDDPRQCPGFFHADQCDEAPESHQTDSAGRPATVPRQTDRWWLSGRGRSTERDFLRTDECLVVAAGIDLPGAGDRFCLQQGEVGRLHGVLGHQGSAVGSTVVSRREEQRP